MYTTNNQPPAEDCEQHFLCLTLTPSSQGLWFSTFNIKKLYGARDFQLLISRSCTTIMTANHLQTRTPFHCNSSSNCLSFVVCFITTHQDIIRPSPEAAFHMIHVHMIVTCADCWIGHKEMEFMWAGGGWKFAWGYQLHLLVQSYLFSTLYHTLVSLLVRAWYHTAAAKYLAAAVVNFPA